MKYENQFLILLAGDIYADERLQSLGRSSRVIAADGGIKHAQELDVICLLYTSDAADD